jgi:hypothetical protein
MRATCKVKSDFESNPPVDTLPTRDFLVHILHPSHEAPLYQRSSHLSQLARQVGVLLDKVKLRVGCLNPEEHHQYPRHVRTKVLVYVLIRQRVDQLGFVPCQLSMTFEHAYCDVDFALLQAQLCQSRNCRFTFRIRTQCLVAASLRSLDILLPLEQS